MTRNQLFLIGGVGLTLYAIPMRTPQKNAPVPTFSKDIAPILYKRCVPCHSDTKIAPFSLIGYQSAKKRAMTIKAVTQSGFMPPWKAKKGYGEFKDVPTLSDQEKKLIAQWADAGAPEGNPAGMPTVAAMAPGWRMGKPDLILKPELPTEIRAEGKDFFRDYLVDPKVTKPTWVRIIDFKPLLQGTVHHIIPHLVSKEETLKLRQIKFDHKDNSWNQKTVGAIKRYNTLGFWSTGAPPFISPDQTAFLVNPGDSFLLDVHYKSTGRVVQEQVEVALYFQDAAPREEMSVTVIASEDIYLQPNEENVRVYAIGPKTKVETTIYAVWPHMHYLGRTMKAWVKYPAGFSKPLVCIDDWDPDWQLLYYLKTPMKLPRGSRIYVTGTYDNSTKNPRNPNSPPRVIEAGESSSDEMLFFEVFQVEKKQPEKEKS